MLPILVDVVETVNWSGATTSWSDAGQGDILISNPPQGTAAFEVLFHEASHLLLDRGARDGRFRPESLGGEAAQPGRQ
jgi:hypothetical protein